MKELSIEQKAQRYDEAIAHAKKLLKTIGNATLGNLVLKNEFERMFPELAESEDDRIRKALRERIIRYDPNNEILIKEEGISQKQFLAWLEKQSEEKPTDKVEPKFHEGDWLCENEPNNYARFIQILEIVNVQGKERYRISRDINNDEDIVEFDFVEKYYHKFDIKDARDGDVLTCYSDIKGQPIEQTGIIKQYVGRHGGCSNSFKAYFGVDWDNNVVIEGYMGSSNIYPATKKQRDTLMKAMADAGYTFDFEKKELKKIEQNPAWSEDERMLEELLNYCDTSIQYNGIESPQAIKWKKRKEWLKSLKNREQLQQKQEWSEKDKCMLNNVIDTLKPLSQTTHSGYAINSMINWLNSLRPQTTCKPSEEYIKVCKEVYADILSAKGLDLGTINSELNRLEEELKKLREE